MAIGDPADEFQVVAQNNTYGPSMTVQWWLPIPIKSCKNSGRVAHVLGQKYERYARHVYKSTFRILGFFESLPPVSYVLPLPFRPVRVTGDVRSRIIETSVKEPVGATIVAGFFAHPDSTASAYASFDWLPAPNSEDPSVWSDLLADLGIVTETPPPTWMSYFETPREAASRQRVQECERQLEKAKTQADLAIQEHSEEARFGRLLYADGTELEDIVREVIVILGAKLDEPSDGKREDAFATLPNGTRAAMEFKGKQANVKLDDLRQLLQWYFELMKKDEEWGVVATDYKKIFITNAYKNRAPAEREAPYVGDACERFIRDQAICILTTKQLYDQVCKLQADAFDALKFWTIVVASVGVPELD